MEKNYSFDMPIRATMKDMDIEDMVHFPVTKLSVVRTTASNLSIEMTRRYKTKLNRKTMMVDVIRLA